ncbi:MAG: hypothetical protein ABIF77_19700 [bacterium]
MNLNQNRKSGTAPSAGRIPRQSPHRILTWIAMAGGVALLVCGLLYFAAPVAHAASQVWESWGTESYQLGAGESFQFTIEYDQIPIRSWRLVVDGDHILCDLHVLRLRNESLLYYEREESRHEVEIPWGRGEQILVALTSVGQGGVYTVDLIGPPSDSVPASYSYEVNRALEAYAAGKRLEAEALCEEALAADENDGVALVLLAGFLRDRHFYEQAREKINAALKTDLPEDMQNLGLQLQSELDDLLMPLPEPIRRDLAEAERSLGRDDPEQAVNICDRLLESHEDLSAEALSRVLQCRGQALHQMGRNFEAVDAYTQALTATRSRAAQAVIYFRMGRLFQDMDNPTQAVSAFSIARKYGLPAGLDLQAEEALKQIEQN